jgi:hypothetical protein
MLSTKVAARDLVSKRVVFMLKRSRPPNVHLSTERFPKQRFFLEKIRSDMDARVDAMIDRAVKRLVQTKAMKQMSGTTSANTGSDQSKNSWPTGRRISKDCHKNKAAVGRMHSSSNWNAKSRSAQFLIARTGVVGNKGNLTSCPLRQAIPTYALIGLKSNS